MRAEGGMTARRILCVFPRYTSSFGTFEHAYPLTDGVQAFMPPQGILLIAAYLPENWDVRFVDENIRPASQADFEWAEAVFVSGMNRSMQFTATSTLAYADVPQDQMRSATTLFSVLAQMNTGMGIALGALALSVTELLRGTPAGQPGVGDFHGAFLAMAALALLALVDCWRLPADAGQRLLQR